MSTPQKAAGQLVWLAEGRPGTDWESGVYYERRKPAKRIHPQTRDSNVARQLWDESMHLLKLPVDSRRSQLGTLPVTGAALGNRELVRPQVP